MPRTDSSEENAVTVVAIEGTWIVPVEAARRLGVHANTIRRWVDAGRLLGIRTISGRLIDADAVERLRAEREADDS